MSMMNKTVKTSVCDCINVYGMMGSVRDIVFAMCWGVKIHG